MGGLLQVGELIGCQDSAYTVATQEPVAGLESSSFGAVENERVQAGNADDRPPVVGGGMTARSSAPISSAAICSSVRSSSAARSWRRPFYQVMVWRPLVASSYSRQVRQGLSPSRRARPGRAARPALGCSTRSWRAAAAPRRRTAHDSPPPGGCSPGTRPPEPGTRRPAPSRPRPADTRPRAAIRLAVRLLTARC